MGCNPWQGLIERFSKFTFTFWKKIKSSFKVYLRMKCWENNKSRNFDSGNFSLEVKFLYLQGVNLKVQKWRADKIRPTLTGGNRHNRSLTGDNRNLPPFGTTLVLLNLLTSSKSWTEGARRTTHIFKQPTGQEKQKSQPKPGQDSSRKFKNC